MSPPLKNLPHHHPQQNEKQAEPRARKRAIWIPSQQRNKGRNFVFYYLAQKQMEVQKDLYACFIDYAKAFDRVKHSEMVAALARTGIDEKNIRIITEGCY